MRIYITNLRSEVIDDDLRKLFETYGKVTAAEIVKTFSTNKSTGFGFVEMESLADLTPVFKELNGKYLKGNPIKIFDRRTTFDRRGETNRRIKNVRRIFDDRLQTERRQYFDPEGMVSMFSKLDRRETNERRISEQRNPLERRFGDRRIGLERRQLGSGQ